MPSDDHDLAWFVALLEMRLQEMGPRDRTLNIKFGRASAHRLLANLRANRDGYANADEYQQHLVDEVNRHNLKKLGETP